MAPITKLDNLTREEVMLLQEALYEFMHVRGPTPEAYVARRYADPGYDSYEDKWRTEKVKNVKARIALAEALRNRLFNPAFYLTPESEHSEHV